jgi:hypothetical protein
LLSVIIIRPTRIINLLREKGDQNWRAYELPERRFRIKVNPLLNKIDKKNLITVSWSEGTKAFIEEKPLLKMRVKFSLIRHTYKKTLPDKKSQVSTARSITTIKPLEQKAPTKHGDVAAELVSSSGSRH